MNTVYGSTATVLLEKEQEVVIRSIVNCFRKQDIRYLLPPAYHWLISCGMPSYEKWSNFTEAYGLFPIFEYDFFALQKRVINTTVEGSRYFNFFEQRETIYNSILRAVRELKENQK
jgi:hypothetical protein